MDNTLQYMICLYTDPVRRPNVARISELGVLQLGVLLAWSSPNSRQSFHYTGGHAR